MKIAIYTILFLLSFSIFSFGQNSIGLIGGNIFDGKKFVKKDLYIADGKITFEKPGTLEKTIKIENQFVIPPFGDAHTHNLDREFQLTYLPEQYLKEGTFYVQNLTAKTKNIDYFRKYFSTKQTPDVIFANQGISSTSGHPFMAYEPYVMGLYDASKWKDNIEKIRTSRLDEGNSYIFIDSKKAAKEKLKGFFAGKPDIVKIFLVDVGNFEKNSVDEILGNSGLPAELAEYVTKESQKRGLKVYAHIDTAEDFETGVKIGVDGFAHMPTWNGKPETKQEFQVSKKVLEKAANRNIVISPTIAITTGGTDKDSQEYKNQIEFIRQFLSKYHKLGGTILIGSDYFNRPLTVELKAFIEVDAFEELELLKIVSETTPRAIFPERKIGFLKEGYEGSVLVLKKNPLEDSENLFGITHWIKQGQILKFD
ncbi:MAG: hypothetical protein HKN25_06815 [Pyrinomonadaceae bacterium]|nr:hypothetical protein [Pyrinomonadaceae bacterium]